MHEHQNYVSNYQRIAKLITKNYIHRLFTPDCLSVLPELNLRENVRILDVGCKNGKLIFKLASFLKSGELHGVDIEPDCIKRNQTQNHYENVYFHCSPAENMPFEDGYFDLIVCTNALHHFPQRVRALDEMYRVSKPEGELYLLEGIRDQKWKAKLDKILRQSKFILPEKKYLPRTAIFSKSYFIHYVK